MSTLSLSSDTSAMHPARGAAPAAPAAAPGRHRSTRAFRPDPLRPGEVAQLLQAAMGTHRPGSWGRTAPSALHWREITVYAVLPQGSYRYDPHREQLDLVTAEDLRALAQAQDLAAAAPLHLVYVADFDRAEQAHAEEHGFPAGADAGAIVESVYLHCAGCGLATAVRGPIDRHRLAQALRLGPTQRIVLAQTVGRPAPQQGALTGESPAITPTPQDDVHGALRDALDAARRRLEPRRSAARRGRKQQDAAPAAHENGQHP